MSLSTDSACLEGLGEVRFDLVLESESLRVGSSFEGLVRDLLEFKFPARHGSTESRGDPVAPDDAHEGPLEGVNVDGPDIVLIDLDLDRFAKVCVEEVGPVPLVLVPDAMTIDETGALVSLEQPTQGLGRSLPGARPKPL